MLKTMRTHVARVLRLAGPKFRRQYWAARKDRLSFQRAFTFATAHTRSVNE